MKKVLGLYSVAFQKQPKLTANEREFTRTKAHTKAQKHEGETDEPQMNADTHRLGQPRMDPNKTRFHHRDTERKSSTDFADYTDYVSRSADFLL
jgi:hypothetical protein